MQVDQNQWCPVRMSHWREMKSIIILTPYHVLLGPWDCTTNSISLHCWTPSSRSAWYRHTCSTCTPAVRAHLQYVHTCSTCTPAIYMNEKASKCIHLQYIFILENLFVIHVHNIYVFGAICNGTEATMYIQYIHIT